MPAVMIEGPDGTGKSTLAEKVVEAARVAGFENARLEHYGVPSYDPTSQITIGQQAMNQLLERLLDYDYFTSFVVLDRFHWGEPAYAPIFRPQLCVHPVLGTLQESEFLHAQRWLNNIGAAQVYVDAPEDLIMRRLGIRGDEELLSPDDEKRLAQIRRIKRNYKTLMDWHSGRCATKKLPRYWFRSGILETPEDTEYLAHALVRQAIGRADATAFRMKSVYRMEHGEVVRRAVPKLFEGKD